MTGAIYIDIKTGITGRIGMVNQTFVVVLIMVPIGRSHGTRKDSLRQEGSHVKPNGSLCRN